MFIREKKEIKERLAISGRNGRRVYVPLTENGVRRFHEETGASSSREVVPRVTRAVRNGGVAVIPAHKVLGAVIQRGTTIRVGETPVAVHPPKEEHPQTEPQVGVEVKAEGGKPPEPPKETAVGIGGDVSPEQPDPPKETWRKRRRRMRKARMADGLEGLL